MTTDPTQARRTEYCYGRIWGLEISQIFEEIHEEICEIDWRFDDDSSDTDTRRESVRL
jgi:hypothetical protein